MLRRAHLTHGEGLHRALPSECGYTGDLPEPGLPHQTMLQAEVEEPITCWRRPSVRDDTHELVVEEPRRR